MSETRDERPPLPPGWRWRRVGEIAHPVRRTVDPKTTTASLYLGMEHIEPWTGRILGRGSSREVRSAKVEFEAGDILYGKLRPYLAKIAVAPTHGICSTELLALRATNDVAPEFLAAALRQRSFVDAVNDATQGTQLPRAKASDVLSLEVALPPVSEQQKISRKLSSLLLGVETERARLERAQANMRLAMQKMSDAAFRGELSAHARVSGVRGRWHVVSDRSRTVRRGVPEHVAPTEFVEQFNVPGGWTKISVAELLRRGCLVDVKDGNHGANHPKTSELGTSGRPFIMAKDVRGFRIDYVSAAKVDGGPLARIRVGFAKANDVVLTHKGTVGEVAVCEQECVLTPQTTYYRCDGETIFPRYLMYLLASPFVRDQMRNLSEQTTRDYLPISEQYRLFLVLCGIDEQREIVKRLDDAFATLDDLETRVARALRQCDRLRESLLQRAFRGELLSADDTPAGASQASLPSLDPQPAI